MAKRLTVEVAFGGIRAWCYIGQRKRTAATSGGTSNHYNKLPRPGQAWWEPSAEDPRERRK